MGAEEKCCSWHFLFTFTDLYFRKRGRGNYEREKENPVGNNDSAAGPGLKYHDSICGRRGRGVCS